MPPSGRHRQITLRTPLSLDVIRDRNALFRETAEGWVENVYLLRLINMDDAAHRFEISIEAAGSMALVADGRSISVPPDGVSSTPARVRADPHRLGARSTPFLFHVRAVDDPELEVREEARFVGPTPRP